MPEIWFPNLGIEIQHVSRVAISIFGLDIYWYGVIITLAVFTGIAFAVWEAKKTGQNPDIYTEFVLYAFIVAFVCARLYYVIFAWDMYKDNLLKIFAIREGGLAIYGGIIGSVVSAIVYCKVKKIDLGIFVDTACPSLVLGQAIGRWGNFFNKEAFGGYTESLFAMRYDTAMLGYVPQSVASSSILVNGVTYIQVHPTFLYESIWCIAIFLFLHWFKKRKRFNGELLLLYFLGYGLGRFWIEGLRTDQLFLFGTNIPVSQLLSAVLVAGSTIALVLCRKRYGLPEKID